MSRWPDPDRMRIGSYVASLDLRNLKSRTCYQQVLHSFQDIVERHGMLDQQALQAWLRELASRWATSTLLHRTRIIDRFLDHLLATGAIDHNPVEALREACHIKQSMPIWRALIWCNPEQALARLRQPKPFDSVLGEVMAEHVAMMRRRGYKYTSQSVRLLEFDRFLQLNPHLETEPLSVMIDQWAAAKGARNHAYERTRILPLPDSVMTELRAYIAARRQVGAPQDPHSALFWHVQRRSRYTPEMITWLLTDVVRRAGLKPLQGQFGPRVHDLRHSMVVNRILEWYRLGINPQDRLPFLATYLGHRDINSTLVYITVTQDLLHLANERFRAVGAPCLNLEREVRS
ncbi:tyrosine-type recombinase/integrase [Ensifer sp. NBAIM29]|nr:tyrosine-type recombinase/integrase [Ensifer sp. NBAIM29]